MRCEKGVNKFEVWKGGVKIVGVNWVAKYFRFEKGVNKFVWKGGAKIVGVNWVEKYFRFEKGVNKFEVSKAGVKNCRCELGVKNLRCEKGVKIFSVWKGCK